MNKKIQKLVYLFNGRNITYDISNSVIRIDESGNQIKMSSVRIILHPFGKGIYG